MACSNDRFPTSCKFTTTYDSKDVSALKAVSQELGLLENLSYTVVISSSKESRFEGVTHSFLAAAPYRAPNQETEDASSKLFAMHHALRDVSVKMITLPPQLVVPIPMDQMEKITLQVEKLSRAQELSSIACSGSLITLSTETKKTLAHIYANIFNLSVSNISAGEDFFELGGTSIDVIRLKREGESVFMLLETPTIRE
ncbi:hypothetical protein OG21DRAFT_1491329 [Imleria badia]|nr:hypothetical protein OG21DRAFT_1491329 [Imleria badia]